MMMMTKLLVDDDDIVDDDGLLLGELLGNPVHPGLQTVAEVSEPGCLIIIVSLVFLQLISSCFYAKQFLAKNSLSSKV